MMKILTRFRMPTTRLRRMGSFALLLLMIFACLGAALPFVARSYTAMLFDEDIYPADKVPAMSVAIIFGAEVRPNGRLSAMLRDRVRAGVDLYEQGKVEWLLMSGDNQDDNHNETRAMRRYALELGIPADAVREDEYGYRTYDTCYRAKHVYNIDEAILVSQEFHIDRALLLCNSLGVKSVGVVADSYGRGYGYQLRRSKIREYPATVLAFLDLIRRPAPTVPDKP